MSHLKRLIDRKKWRNSQRRYFQIYKKYANYTMIPEWLYTSNLRVAEGLKSIAGSVVECGVWRGGMSAGMAEVLGPARDYYLFDSFEGLPPAKEIDGVSAMAWQADIESPGYHDNCTAEIFFSQRAMALSGASKFHLIKGWFDETLKKVDIVEPIAILRLDGDWYDSTMCCLMALAPKIAPEGIIMIDDYYTWDGCSRAVHDYLSCTKSTLRINTLFGVAVMKQNQAAVTS